MTHRLLPAALVLAALAVFGFAGPAGAISAPAVSTAQSALNGATNDGCLSCHGVRGKTPPVTVGSEQKSTYVDRARYERSRHGKLACTSCHLGFKPGIHDASQTATAGSFPDNDRRSPLNTASGSALPGAGESGAVASR